MSTENKRIPNTKEFTITAGTIVEVETVKYGGCHRVAMGNEEYFWVYDSGDKIVRCKFADVTLIEPYGINETVFEEDTVRFVNTPIDGDHIRKGFNGGFIDSSNLYRRYQICIEYDDDIYLTLLQKEIEDIRSCVPKGAVDVTEELCLEDDKFNISITYSLLETDAQRDARIVYEESIIRKRKEEIALKKVNKIKKLQEEIANKRKELEALMKQQDS